MFPWAHMASHLDHSQRLFLLGLGFKFRSRASVIPGESDQGAFSFISMTVDQLGQNPPEVRDLKSAIWHHNCATTDCA